MHFTAEECVQELVWCPLSLISTQCTASVSRKKIHLGAEIHPASTNRSISRDCRLCRKKDSLGTHSTARKIPGLFQYFHLSNVHYNLLFVCVCALQCVTHMVHSSSFFHHYLIGLGFDRFDARRYTFPMPRNGKTIRTTMLPLNIIPPQLLVKVPHFDA